MNRPAFSPPPCLAQAQDMLALPCLLQTASGWQVQPQQAAKLHGVSLQMVTDLANYGIVGPLAEVGAGCLLWLPNRPLNDVSADAAHDLNLSHLLPLPSVTMPADVIKLGFISPGQASQAVGSNDFLSAGRALAASRMLSTRLRLPCVDSQLLSVMLAAPSLSNLATPLVLNWGQDAITNAARRAAFLALLRPASQAAFLQQEQILRQRRREALQLSASLDNAQLEQQILARMILPMAQLCLDAGLAAQSITPTVQVRLQLSGATTSNLASEVQVPHIGFALDDPLGENLFALVLRRICMTQQKAEVLRHFAIAPYALAKKVKRLAPDQMDGAAQAAMAVLQLDFLQAARQVK